MLISLFNKRFSAQWALLAFALLAVCFLLPQANAAVAKSKLKTITIELTRNVISPWAKNNTKQVNDFCYSPTHSRPKRPLIFKTPMPANCTEARVSRISEECVFKNLAYTVKMVFPEISNSNSDSDSTPVKKSNSNKQQSNSFVRLAVDLTSPWSWIKSPVC